MIQYLLSLVSKTAYGADYFSTSTANTAVDAGLAAVGSVLTSNVGTIILIAASVFAVILIWRFAKGRLAGRRG